MSYERIANLTSIKRLPSYIRALYHFRQAGREVVSTTHLAEYLGVDAITVRKDLAITEVVGKPGSGYPVSELLDALETFLGWHNETDAFLVGMGNLGRALCDYEGLKRHGLNIVGAFDTDPAKIKPEARPVPVFPMERMSSLARRMHINIGILAVPASAAQEATDAMVDAGLIAIWSFAPAEISVPEGIIVQREDIASGFAVLSRKLHRVLHSEGTN